MKILLFSVLMAGCSEVVQTDACAHYVDCMSARDAAIGASTDIARFQVDGACWSGADGAELCDRACANGLDWMRSAYDELPQECR